MRLERSDRRLVALALLAVCIAGVGGALALRAQDRGSAAVALLGILVTSALALLSRDVRVGLGLSTHSLPELRRLLLDRLGGTAKRLNRQAKPAERRTELRIAELVRVSSKTAREGSTADLQTWFDEAGRRAVVVGAPGAGKTTAAMALFDALLRDARSDEDAPVPVLLDLASWSETDSLEDWLVVRIAREWSLRRRDAEALLPAILPLLDGLDEVPRLRRQNCAVAIGRFVERNPGAKIVVCSRRAEFEELPFRSTGSLPVFLLEPLHRADVGAFLVRVDPQHWAPVIAAVADGQSPLATAVSTPLMLAVMVDAWDDADPRQLVALAEGSDVGAIRDQLWLRWVEQASRRAPRAGLARIARTLAAAAEHTGAAEVRIERLGDTRTRWAWYAMQGLVGAALAVLVENPVIAVIPFFLRLVEVTEWLSARAKRNSGKVRHLAGAVKWSFILLGALPSAFIVALAATDLPVSAIGAIASFGGGLAVAALVAAAPLPVEETFRPRATDALTTVRDQTLVVCGAGAVVAGALLLLGVSPAWAAVSGFLTFSLFGGDAVGHHWVARLRYRRAVQPPGLRAAVSGLVEAGFLRRTGDAYRFFHLELQRFLAGAHQGPLAYPLENLGPDVLFEHAVERLREGDAEAALALWNRVLDARPNSVSALLNRARTLVRLQRPAEALADLETARRIDPNDAYVVRDLANARRRGGDPAAARAAFDEALRHGPNDMTLLGEYAWLCYRLGDLDGSVELYDRVVTTERDAWHHLTNYAVVRWARGEHTETRALYERALEVAPGSAAAHSDFAYFLYRTGDRAAAEVHFGQALAAEPNHPRALARYAAFKAATGDTDGAIELHDRALEEDASSAINLSTYATLCRRIGRRDRARELFERAVASDPNSAGDLTQLGDLVYGDNPERARGHYAHAAGLEPSSAPILTKLAIATEATGEAVEAFAVFERAVAADPTNLWPATAYARALQRSGEPGRADAVLGAASERVGLDADAAALHASVKTELGNVPGARERYEQALDLAPENAVIAANFALLEESCGDAERARELLDRAAGLAPDHARIQAELGRYIARHDDGDEAERRLTAALERLPDDPTLLVTLGTVRRDRGDLGEARALFERALEQRPDHHQALNEWARLEFGADDLQRASELYERVHELAPDNAGYLLNHAYVLHADGRLEAALERRQRAVELRPGLATAHAQLAASLLTTGDVAGGEAELERAITLAPHDVGMLVQCARSVAATDGARYRATPVWARVEQAAPGNAALLDEHARHHRAIGDVRAATDVHERAIAADPTHANASGNFARHLLEQGEHERGIDLARCALKHASDGDDPLRAEAWFYLAALGPPEEREEAVAQVESLLERGVRSTGFDLSGVCDVVERDRPGDAAVLRRLATVLSGDERFELT